MPKKKSCYNLSNSDIEVIGQRLKQLDHLYSIANTLEEKFDYLVQIVHIAKELNVIDSEEFHEFELRVEYVIGSLGDWTHVYVTNEEVWRFRHRLLRVLSEYRAKLLIRFVEKGIIRDFEGIPIAIAKGDDKHADSE